MAYDDAPDARGALVESSKDFLRGKLAFALGLAFAFGDAVRRGFDCGFVTSLAVVVREATSGWQIKYDAEAAG